MARKKSDRTIYSEARGPAQLYHFVDVASFTEDWADLRLGDDELRALEDEIALATRRGPPSFRAAAVPGEIRRPDPTSGEGQERWDIASSIALPPYSTGRCSSSPHGPSPNARTWDPTTPTRPIGKAIARIQKLLDEGGKIKRARASFRAGRGASWEGPSRGLADATSSRASRSRPSTPCGRVRIILRSPLALHAGAVAVRELIGASQEGLCPIAGGEPDDGPIVGSRGLDASPRRLHAASSTRSPCCRTTSGAAILTAAGRRDPAGRTKPSQRDRSDWPGQRGVASVRPRHRGPTGSVPIGPLSGAQSVPAPIRHDPPRKAESDEQVPLPAGSRPPATKLQVVQRPGSGTRPGRPGQTTAATAPPRPPSPSRSPRPAGRSPPYWSSIAPSNSAIAPSESGRDSPVPE